MKRLKVTLRAPAASASAALDASSAADVLESRWTKLAAFISAVHAASRGGGSASRGYSFEELYGAVADCCSLKLAPALFARLRGVCDARAAALLEPLAEGTPDAGAFLASVEAAWSAHCHEVVLLRAVFSHLDAVHVATLPSVRSLWDMGLGQWRDALMRSDLLVRTTKGVVDLLQREREGGSIDRSPLVAVSRMLHTLGLTASHLVPPLLAAAKTHYDREGAAEASGGNVPAYLLRVESRLSEERERAVACLGANTSTEGASLLRATLAIVEDGLVAAHATSLLERGVTPLLTASRLEDLSRLHALISRVGRLDALRSHFSSFVKVRASEIVGVGGRNDDDMDKALVASLLELKADMDAAIERSFGGNDSFASALRSVLEACINARADKPAELMAKFIDSKMRGGGKGGSGGGGDLDIELLLDRVMALFRCIHGKDVFEAFYKKDLAKRLLLGRSASTALEKSMVSRLKTECGGAFTAKLEGMFRDIELAEDLNVSFGASAPAGAAASLFVHILTASHWPTYTPVVVSLPVELSTSSAAFEAFYLAKFSGRRLAWLPSLGHCIVKAVFPGGRKELDVSLYQALVLLLFNNTDAPSFTFLQLRDATGIAADELRRTLQSLALGVARVLRKEPKGREVADDDAFSFNAAFTHALVRVKINQIQLKETKQEADATTEKVVADRQYQIDAAIVRIMKARKTLSYQLLLAELFAQLRFPATPADFKKRIESLIERDYLERDSSDFSTFKYVA